ncbi:hypothetical protein D3C81_2313720 [compost metagenome]
MEQGITTITYNPEDKDKKLPLSTWLKSMGKTRHMLKPEYAETTKAFELEVERRWSALKAKHEHPAL